MDEGALVASWAGAWNELGRAPPEALRIALMQRYAEPQRAYHTLQHLGECMAHLARERGSAERPAEVALALWFHDAVYELQRHDNEAQSADWARRTLQAEGIPQEAADRVHALVMATRHDALPEGADACLLVDIDLAILGAPEERFAEYERQIRIEYAHVPPEVFEPRRRGILGAFLAREPLYRTVPMRERLEAQARRNLQRAIEGAAPGR